MVPEEVLVDTDEVGWMGGVTIEDVSEEEDGYLPSPVRASVVMTMPTPPTICTVFNKFESTAINCPRSLQILYCQKKLFCTLQRIHSSVALLPDYLVKKSLQFWRGLDCSVQARVFQLCKKTAKIGRY